MELLKRKLFHLIQTFAHRKGFVISYTQRNLGRERRFDLHSKPDYIRLSALEMAANEIYNNNIPGNIAEVGVYKGEFAKYMNAAFKDRPLYLFDTFEGFDSGDITNDKHHKYAEQAKNMFKDTSIDLVMSKMVHPDLCIIKKGYFPETAIGLESEFAFVSLDADLYDPIYDGLKYFYPRLSKGGYIFIHDYNNAAFAGSKSAVKTFCRENSVSYVPLCDGWGTAVITK